MHRVFAIVAVLGLVAFTIVQYSDAQYSDTLYSDIPRQSVQPQIQYSEIIDIEYTDQEYKRYLIFGSGYMDVPNSHMITTDNGFFAVSVISETSAARLAALGYTVIEDYKLDFHADDASRIAKTVQADIVHEQYGFTGKGATVAIVDTGVDFSNPDIRHSLARDKNNHPIMLDPDGQGIIITNATFYANIDEHGIIQNVDEIPENMTSSVYVSDRGVFLDINKNNKGTVISIYNSFFPAGGNSIVFNGTLDKDMKIGRDRHNYIKSASGIYKLGVMYQGSLDGPLARIQVVPILVVDSFKAGIYDTIIPDMSTSWKDFTRFDLKDGKRPNYDFDFTDERPIVLGSGNEFLVYDSNRDGRDDYTAGTVGARVLDIYGAIHDDESHIDDHLGAVNGTLLPALDPNGDFFGVMTDFDGHGTSSAATITSRGVSIYHVYNDTREYTITGVAPDAKIVPIKALWFGDVVYGWLWAAGFDNTNGTWKFTGNSRADIISNSWGVSTFPGLERAPGMDILSLIIGVLTVPQSLHDDYGGVLMITSAGNAGHGYGTISLPGGSPFSVSVGATTNNVFVGYGPFKDQPRFGNKTIHQNHIVDFSSRGPSIIGDPKPDIMGTGAYSFTPSSVLSKKDSTVEPFRLYGGTSMAAPMIAGAAAVLIEASRENGFDYDPFVLKRILMSSADDLYNDPFTQGAGLVDVYAAVRYINGTDGTFSAYNDGSFHNVLQVLSPAMENVNSSTIGLDRFKLPDKSMQMASWFAGQLMAGERSTTTYTIHNPSNDTIRVDIIPQRLSLVGQETFTGVTVPREQDPVHNKSSILVPNYVRLADVHSHTSLKELFDERYIPDTATLMVLNVNFDFDTFLNDTTTYADDLQISSLYVYDWIDGDDDTDIDSDELVMVNRGGSWGTVQELRVNMPTEQFEGVPLVGIYPVPVKYSYWVGDTKHNATAMNYTLSASYYAKERWPLVWTSSQSIEIPPRSTETVDITLVVPNVYSTGVYQGFLTFVGDHHTVNSPVSFVVKEPVTHSNDVIVVHGTNSSDVLYGTGYIKGAFDMTSRYMAGDWRQFYFDIQDNSTDSAVLEVSWYNKDTSLALFVMDPVGRIVQTNVPSGVFGELNDWPSLDWLGVSSFSEGGGFYPIKNKDETSTVIYIPINQTGTYSVMAHATLFGGDSTTEQIDIVGRFSDSTKIPTLEDVDVPSGNDTKD